MPVSPTPSRAKSTSNRWSLSCARTCTTRSLPGSRSTASPPGWQRDALGPLSIGRHAFETALAQAALPLLVTEEAIIEARRFLWERVRVLAEPAASVPLAAVMSGVVPVEAGMTVALVVSGGNNPTIP